MKKTQPNLTEAEILRQKAEGLLKKKFSKTVSNLSEVDMLKLVHELQVHQIELELQNEALVLVKEEADLATQKYIELYDFAPSGYVTLSDEGTIIEINLHAASMLGKERQSLINNTFGLFVSHDTRPIFNNFLSKVFEGEKDESCELAISIVDNKLPLYVLLTGHVSEDITLCHVTMIDITERKMAEEEIINIKESLRMLNNRFEDISENERKLISRELHDQLGQSLTALKMDISWLSEKIPSDSEEGAKLKGINELLISTVKDVQRISSELHPAMLEDLGLHTTIEWYCGEFKNRTGIDFHLKSNDIQFPDEKKSLVLYRILQEALTNVARHANAKNVNISLFQADDSIVMEVIDNGIGLEKEKIYSYKSLGFIGMRERAKKYKGCMNISSVLNKGTTLSVSIPFN